MPGFADSFWTPDYTTGLEVLYGKLLQGVTENQQILTITNMRVAAEELYSSKIGDIAPALDRFSSGFTKDEGASVRKAYDGIRGEMMETAKNHHKIASNIRELVIIPFSRWCDEHAARIQNSHDDLQAHIKDHAKQAELVKKLRSQYFNKCRLVEDLEEENKLAFQSPETSSPKVKQTPKIVLPDEQEAEDEPEPVELGDKLYTHDELKKLLAHVLENIKISDVKVPILGTYQNTSIGMDIVEYVQKNLNASSVSYAERVGQDLVNNGFLRLVGNMGNIFANSSRMNYQWRSKAFTVAGLPEKKKPLTRVSSVGTSEDSSDSPVATVSEILAGWNPLNNPYPNETPAEKLRREAREADERYKSAVKKLDDMRCKLEEAVIEHLRFMERCELDRLKAIKSVVLDFSGAISNVIPGLKSIIDNMMLYQETIQPLGDLRYLLENYRTGGFVPRVQAYENYYGSVGNQTFGVDLEARARADRKRVPIVVTTILTFLDNQYPELEGDEARRAIWLYDVPLGATHHLRKVMNDSNVDYREVFPRYEIPIVASVLKLYLLELPDSLVSSQVYEIIKTVYSTTTDETTQEGRIKVLQSTLGQLRLNNIATLDAIMTHFTRLIDLTSADETYVSALAQSLAPCILRPRVENSLTVNERHSYRLIRDLFNYKDSIFGELKRNSNVNALAAGSAQARPRAISSDESNRRAAMEARQRAIASRAHAASPAPSTRHRRDRSTDGSGSTRFPINVGSPPAVDRRQQLRQSLEVPDSSEGNQGSTQQPLPIELPANGSAESAQASVTAAILSDGSDGSPTPTGTPVAEISDPVIKRNSLNRSAGRYSRKPTAGRPGVGMAADAIGKRNSIPEAELTGVRLEDKPMDD